jgi:hypothetical protein
MNTVKKALMILTGVCAAAILGAILQNAGRTASAAVDGNNYSATFSGVADFKLHKTTGALLVDVVNLDGVITDVYSVTIPATDGNFLVDLIHAYASAFASFDSDITGILLYPESDPNQASPWKLRFLMTGAAASPTTSPQFPSGGQGMNLSKAKADAIHVVSSGAAFRCTVEVKKVRPQ